MIVVAAKWWPIAFAEVLALTGAVAVTALYVLGPPYFRDTAWIILVPVVPLTIATFMLARRLGYVVAAP